jgi:putative MATE family efflux protein
MDVELESETARPLPPLTAVESPPGLWSAVRESLAGGHHEYTTGPIDRAILLLAVPMVLELCLESVFAVVDVFFVSRLGADAVATVGLTESMLIVVYSIAMGLGVGAAAIVARRTGERDAEGAARAAVQAIVLAVLVSAPIALCGFFYGGTLLEMMGASPGVLANRGYTTVVLGGNVVIMLLFLINAVFRGAGDAAIAMRVLWIANAINICLDPCLIFGLGPFPALGVTGAAVATTSGRGIGVLVQLYCLARSDGRLVIRRGHLGFDPAVMLNMVRLSGSAVLQAVIGNTSWIGLVRIIASFGSAAVAGYTIAMRLVVFALLPALGLANAAATLVGQNLGARQPDRAEASVWRACLYNMIFLSAVGAIFVVFPSTLVAAFGGDAQVTKYAVTGLRIVSAGFPFYAYAMVLTSSFNGAGDTLTPTIINVFCFWLWEIPIAYALAQSFGLGPTGVFSSIAVAYSTMAVVSGVWFRKGGWRLKRV